MSLKSSLLLLLQDHKYPSSIDQIERLNAIRARILGDAPGPLKRRATSDNRKLYDRVNASGDTIDTALLQECCDALVNQLFCVDDADMEPVLHTLRNWKTVSDEDVAECKRRLSIACNIPRDQIGKMRPCDAPDWFDSKRNGGWHLFVQVTDPAEFLIVISRDCFNDWPISRGYAVYIPK